MCNSGVYAAGLMHAGTDFFFDPGGVALEFKAFADMVRLFEK